MPSRHLPGTQAPAQGTAGISVGQQATHLTVWTREFDSHVAAAQVQRSRDVAGLFAAA